MIEELFDIIWLLFVISVLVIIITVILENGDIEESENYEIIQVDSIREYSGPYGKKKLRIEYDGKEKSFNHIDVCIGESTHLRRYNNKLISLRLYLSPDDYEKFVGQYESLAVLEGE